MSQIASLSFDYCDGTLFVDDITSSKPYDGRQLYEAGQRLSSGEIRNAFLRSALRPTPGMVDQCADKRGYIVTLPAGALNRHAMLPLSEDYGVRSEQQLDQRRKRIRTLIEMGDGEPVTADMKDLPPTVTVTEVIDGFVPQTLAVSALREVQQLSASTLMLRWMNAALAHGSASLFHTHCQVRVTQQCARV